MSKDIDERYRAVEKIMKQSGYDKSALIDTLHIAQNTFGYLEKKTLKFIAKRLKLPFSKVYGVATFYHYFILKPKGRHNAIVCMGTACYIKGADKILQKIKQRYDIDVGQTTSDGNFSLLSARCVGTCSLAPVVIYDNKSIGKLSLDDSLKYAEEMLK